MLVAIKIDDGLIHNLPRTLKILGIYNASICRIVIPKISNWPPNIKKITISHDYNHNLDNLPNTIEYIRFKADMCSCKKKGVFDKINKFPKNLKQIILQKKYNYNVKKIPRNVKIIFE